MDEAHPESARPSKGPILRLLIIGVVSAVVIAIAIFAAQGSSGQGSSGDRWAKYKGIGTPSSVYSAASESSDFIAGSLGGIAVAKRALSKTMVEDAEGKRFPGGEGNRETQFSAMLLIPRPPFIAVLDGFNWGQPSGMFRLDMVILSPLSFGDGPTVPRGMDAATIQSDPDRLVSLFEDVLESCGLGSRYDARQLAEGSIVQQSWMGEGVMTVASLLPPEGDGEEAGSISIDLGREWAVESIYVDTTDGRNYYDIGR